MNVAPHFDRWTKFDPSETPDGWRQNVADALVRGCPAKEHRSVRIGYMQALYMLRANVMPGAYLRDSSTAQFQDAIARVIAELEDPQQ